MNKPLKDRPFVLIIRAVVALTGLGVIAVVMVAVFSNAVRRNDQIRERESAQKANQAIQKMDELSR